MGKNDCIRYPGEEMIIATFIRRWITTPLACLALYYLVASGIAEGNAGRVVFAVSILLVGQGLALALSLWLELWGEHA